MFGELIYFDILILTSEAILSPRDEYIYILLHLHKIVDTYQKDIFQLFWKRKPIFQKLAEHIVKCFILCQSKNTWLIVTKKITVTYSAYFQQWCKNKDTLYWKWNELDWLWVFIMWEDIMMGLWCNDMINDNADDEMCVWMTRGSWRNVRLHDNRLRIQKIHSNVP